MGKKRSAARRAVAIAAAASAATTTPAVPLDAHTAAVDTPAAPAVRESPTNTQPPRVSHEADAIRAPHAASPTHPTIDALLVCEPAAPDARANTLVALATPETSERETSGSYHPPTKSPPALDAQPSTSPDTTSTAARRTRVSTHENTPAAPQSPLSALSGLAAAAAADLATAIAHMGPPELYITSPVHDFNRVDAHSPESEPLAPRTSLATSIAEIDPELLANIVEDAQRAIRIETRREVRGKALEEGWERGWNEGLAEGRREARREARHEARAEVQQRERAWKDGYEVGRWDGYREGFENAHTEVGTPSSVDASVQADVSNPPHSPPVDTIPTTLRVDAGVQFDAPLLPVPLRTGSPPPVPIDTNPVNPRVDTPVQTDNATSAQTHDLRPTYATEHTDAGVQAEPLAPPSTPEGTHYTYPRVQASTQTDAPRASTLARARTVHEIDHDLLREIIATASAKGEAAGLKQGKHTGFQDGMEAGWKSGTREGREEGYKDGQKDGLTDGYERHRLEVSRIPHSVAVVQTDHVPLPTRVDSASQTATLSVARPTTLPSNGDSSPTAVTSTPTDIHQCTIIPTATGNVYMPHDSFTTTTNTSFTCNNDCSTFSWADEPPSFPTISAAPLISPPPRDFSVLRSSSARPFDSLKRRARRSQARPPRPSRPLRSSIPISEPIITRRHPVGLRADRPSVIVSSSPSVPHLVKLGAPPLDWQGDPRLQELSRVLRGLGWVRGFGS